MVSSPIWRFGDNAITVGHLVAALGVLALAWLAAWALRAGLDRMRRRYAPGGAAFYVAGQIGRYVVIFLGVLAAGSVLGLDLSSLSIFAGALGVGIGLGLQDIVRDFLSGLILMLDRSVEVGDFVELEAGVAGEISSIGARAATIVTNDNVDVLVPNSVLLSGKLTNWTRNRATRRVHVPFGVAYGTEKEKVREAALEAARSVAFTMPDEGNRRTQVWLVNYGDSAMNFELVVWPTLDAVKRPGSMMAAYYWAIDDALRKHGIEIPFPQTDLHVRSFFGQSGEAGLRAWRNDNGGASQTPEKKTPAPSVNDAAREIGSDSGAR